MLDDLPQAALARRREALMAALPAETVLLPCGEPRPRNYAATTFPFRPHSHFLYFFGWGLPGAMGLLGEGRATLYLPAPAPDDALWSGPQPSFAAIAAALGVRVSVLDALPAALAGRQVATLPASDAETRRQQSLLLGRAIETCQTREGRALSGRDALLADAVVALRLRHDDAAVRELERAAAVTAEAHAAGMRATRPGVRESVVRAAMEAQLTALGCTTAYGSIVTVHGEILHNETHANMLAAGDLLLCDVGAESPGGWAGDVTRTWPVDGKYTGAQADVYDVVLEAQRAAIAAVRPGVRYRDLHLLATETLARGLGQLGLLRGDPRERAHDGTAALFFPHGVGHLLGLDVHDMEDLGDRAGYAPGRTRAAEPGLRYLRLDRDLQEGMAVTIEPGVYFVPAILDDPETKRRAGDRVDWNRVEKYRHLRGIRIEDDILVTNSSARVLSAAIPKDRFSIETVLSA